MNETEESENDINLQFEKDNPGAVKYGNFINYYQFHPPENRLKLFPLHIWKHITSFHGLDIGCNAGDLTVELHNFFVKTVKIDPNSCKIIGIDIDKILIERANEKNPTANITFKCCNFMNDSNRAKVVDGYLSTQGISMFSVTFCFSITMWIHLNYGDEGLLKFLKEVCKISQLLVIEPQPWSCYKNAVKRTKKHFEFPFYKQLIIKNVEEEVEKRITDCNFAKIFETPQTSWGRRLLFFERRT